MTNDQHKHQDVFTLAIGDRSVELTKSDRLVGIRPRAGARSDVVAESAAAGGEAQLGGFDVVDVADAGTPLEQTLDELRESPAVEAGTHVYQTSDDGVPFVPTGEIYVEFADTASAQQSTELLAENRLEIVESHGERSFLVRVTPESPNPLKCAAALQASALVDVAEPELATPTALTAFTLPTDPRIADQWHLRNTGRHRGTTIGFVAGADARVLDAWQRMAGLGSAEVVVAVIDDGFDLGHPELSGKIVAPWDFRRGTNTPEPEPGDWHGTACAGVAVGNADGAGIVGVAPDCALMPVRLSTLTGRNIAAWFDYVREQGSWVVSCSWSSQARIFPLPTLARRAITRCAREGRDGRGSVICFAAGNESRDIDEPGSLNGFATHPDVLAVAASNSLDQASNYSNFGAAIAVCAPSSGSPGWGIATSDVRDTPAAQRGYAPGAYHSAFGGTSSACPLVAGVCALVLSAAPDLTAAEVRDIITETARPLAGQSGHHPRFGTGCVNADAAVAAALGPVEAAEPALFHPPGRIGDFAESAAPDAFAQGWDAVIDSWLTGAVDDYGPGFYNPRTSATPGPPAVHRISWAAFPLFLETWFADDDDPDGQRYAAAETLQSPFELREIVNGSLGRPVEVLTRQQDEYCEWFVHRDAAGSVVRVDLTCEGPEYWRFLAHGTRAFFADGDSRAALVDGDLDLVVELYRRHVDPAVQRADLLWDRDVAIRRREGWQWFARTGEYNPYNKWNTTHGAMHLTHPANTLSAEVNLAGGASVLRRGPGGIDITDAEDLIACAGYGDLNRSSDPSIGAGVNALVRSGLSVSLADPVGLYISTINLDAFGAPDGANPAIAWHVDRGNAPGSILRARFEVPEGAGFTVADMTSGGLPIDNGGQIVDHMQMVLVGTAVDRGAVAATRETCATRACVHPDRPGVRQLVGLQTSCAALTAQDWAALAPTLPEVVVADASTVAWQPEPVELGDTRYRPTHR